MNVVVNSNTLLKDAVSRKWFRDEQKESFYTKLTEVRRRKLLRCSEQQNHRCCYCGVNTWHPSYGEVGPLKRLATLEHIVCRSEGGSDSMNNLALACAACNNGRSNLFDAVEYYEMVVGLRPMVRPYVKSKDPEVIKEKQEDQLKRQEKLLAQNAFTLTALNLWWWFDAWYLQGTLSMDEF